MSIHVFSYGSNLCTRRLGARIPAAAVKSVGFVSHRRIAFHKRGADGSAKADAFFTGRDVDRVWGAVYTLSLLDKAVLDRYEGGYKQEQVEVTTTSGAFHAIAYIASADMIDSTLKPFRWYHHLTVQGAREHRLPAAYVQRLQSISWVEDPDVERQRRHLQMVARPADPA